MVQTLQHTALVLIVVFPVLSTVAVALRVWARCAMRQFYWDDGLILLAWLLAVGEALAVYEFTLQSWAGHHYYDIPDLSNRQKVLAGRYNIANQLLYNPILSIVKTSIIVFLWRLDDKRKSVRLALRSFLVLNICLMVAIFFADLLQCTPVRYAWASAEMDTYVGKKVVKKGGTCIDQVNFFLISAGLSVMTDILILLIPPAMLITLNMPTRKKIAVWAVLSAGWVVTIVGVIRIVLYYYRFQPDNIDRSYSVSYTVSGIEANVAIIAACGPAIKALCTQYGIRFLSSRSATGPAAYVYGSPEASARRPGLQGYSRQRDPKGSHADPQYDLQDLGTVRRDGDGDSQEAIVRSASVGTKKSEFDFGLDTDHRAYGHSKGLPI
ncbi:hypothetical protein LTR85_011610 [Meristemomyces frigidus]|nr:hypothetical protein LTR85_011610 [Meristemomyces frigidus]